MNEIDPLFAAGNGLFGRRFFLQSGLVGTTALLTAKAAGLARQPWMQAQGAPMSKSGEPSRFESHVQRVSIAAQPGTTGSGASRTPLEHLDGLITPNRLHFERHHSGIPDIDPGGHRLLIHGLVATPLSFDIDTLARYPTVSRIQFLECSGNSGAMISPTPVQGSVSAMHGLVSASEWTGVPLSLLLEEAGVRADAQWVIADGADAAMMSRSIPLSKMMDDAIVALYQNGERLMPANGYPMRLFLPGWEGNTSVKWLRALKVTDQPSMSKDETSKYSDLLADGSARLFSFEMGVKSLITSPSPGLSLGPSGVYQIVGLAWSGAGSISRVEVSADGGKSWADASLDAHVLPKSLTRFRAAWHWNRAKAVILSRATDDQGNVQPTRAVLMRNRGVGAIYHCNGIQAWQVDSNGEVSNVYV